MKNKKIATSSVCVCVVAVPCTTVTNIHNDIASQIILYGVSKRPHEREQRAIYQMSRTKDGKRRKQIDKCSLSTECRQWYKNDKNHVIYAWYSVYKIWTDVSPRILCHTMLGNMAAKFRCHHDQQNKIDAFPEDMLLAILTSMHDDEIETQNFRILTLAKLYRWH